MADDKTRVEMDADLEKEIADALGDASIEAMLSAAAPPEKSKPKAQPKRGEEPKADRRTGTVISVRGHDVMVELSAKEQGVAPLEQFPETPVAGEQAEFIVVSYLRGEGLYQLALPGRATKADIDSLAEGMVVDAVVSGHNTGGLELTVASQKAFMPISQVELGRVEDLEPYLGQKLQVQVTELDRARKRIVVSRRAVLEVEQRENRERLMEQLAPGQEHDGTVRRIEQYGAFVELAPGADGLLHISDISWSRLKHPTEVLKLGQVVRVQILKVDKEAGRIALGMKQVKGDPWEAVEAKYPVGITLTGTVTRTAAFGAFVEFEPGVEGLIHISQLSEQRVNRIESVVKIGQQITVKVVDVEPDRRRIALSVTALKASEQEESDASPDQVQQYVKEPKKAHAMQSLMDRFGDTGQKGGI
ncbi:MAG: S1 RNA-binding domain-containing protein [Phycisphaeraceae bacterium]